MLTAGDVVVYYTAKTDFESKARVMGIMRDWKDGIPRTAYKARFDANFHPLALPSWTPLFALLPRCTHCEGAADTTTSAMATSLTSFGPSEISAVSWAYLRRAW